MKTQNTSKLSSLPDGDRQDLIWFFGAGQVAFERSTFGYQLERAELFTFGSMRCRECDGRGYLKSMDESIREAIVNLKQWQEANAGRIRLGRTRDRAGDANQNPLVPPDYDDGSCPKCKGAGWVPRATKHPRAGRVTAKPIHGQARQVPEEPSTDALERYGSVSHQLGKLSKSHVATLGAYFGIFGSHWENDPNRGRIWAVRAMTQAAHKLLRMSRNRTKDTENDRELRQDEILNVIAEVQSVNPQRQRGELLAATLGQAETMLEQAEKAWMRDRRIARVVEPPEPVDKERDWSARVERIKATLEVVA